MFKSHNKSLKKKKKMYQVYFYSLINILFQIYLNVPILIKYYI